LIADDSVIDSYAFRLVMRAGRGKKELFAVLGDWSVFARGFQVC